MAGRTARPALSRDRVLAAAMRLADTEGIGVVTMRRLASSVGVEAMSLYHHLPGKEGLLDGLVEAVMGEIRSEIDGLAHEVGADWRVLVRDRCLAARRVMIRHPWAPDLISSRQTIPPSVYGHFEEVLATMIRAGFTYHVGHRAMHALGPMILGFTRELFTPAEAGDAEVSADDLAAMAEAFPHVTAMVAAELHDAEDPTLGWCDSQAEFEFTLDLLLDGLDRARA